MASITYQKMRKVYDDGTEAIPGMDLEVRDGEFMVFVGPSGCGKSTALRMTAGLEDISGGRLLIGDQVPGLNARFRLQITPPFSSLNWQWSLPSCSRGKLPSADDSYL